MKGAVKATGNAVVKSALKASAGMVNGASKAVTNAKKAVVGGHLLAVKAMATVPSYISPNGKLTKKAEAALSKRVAAGEMVGIMASETLQKKLGVYDWEANQRYRKLAVRFWEEWKETRETVKRGKTGKVVVYADISVIPEYINLVLQLRKAVIEVYPELNWSERKVKEIYQKIKDFGKMANDGVGDFFYNSNSSVVSDFAGGFFNVSDMEENSGVAAAVGSFLNGIVYHGFFGTIDGVASVLTDPFSTVEGVNNILRDPKAAGTAVWNEGKRIYDEEVINGSTEDRSRLAGTMFFEVISFVYGVGATKGSKAGMAAKATRAGDKAADIGMTAKAVDAVEEIGGAVKIGDKAADIGKTGKAAETIDNISAAASTAKKIEKVKDVLKHASGMGKTGAAASLKNSASKMMDRILTSNIAKKAVNSMDDIVNVIRKMLDPPGPGVEVAPVTGMLDDIDDMGPFGRRYYENLMKKEKISNGSSGVKIRKAEVVNGTEDLEKIVREGGSEGLDNVKKFLYDADGNYTGGRTKAELNALEYDPAKKCVTVGAQNEAKIGLDLEKKGIIGKLERSPDPRAEFIDSLTGKKYDVKSFESTPMGKDGIPITSPRKGAFKVENAMKNIMKEFQKNGNDIVIIDKSKLTQDHINELMNAINEAGIEDKIIWWPE